MIGELDDGVPTVAYTWGPDGVASRRLLTGTPSSRFYCYGPQGETRNLTDEFQTVTSTYFYEAYGKPKGTVPTEQNPFRYGGKFGYYTDSEIQTLQVGARWYSPNLIRWMSRDPIHYRGGDNLGAYVMGNPVRYFDDGGFGPEKVVTFSRKFWNHVLKRHLARSLFRNKSKFISGSSIKKLALKTVNNPNRITVQKNGITVCEREFGRAIGTEGQTILRVVLDKGGNVITSFPQFEYSLPAYMNSPVVVVGDFLEEFFNPISGGNLE